MQTIAISIPLKIDQFIVKNWLLNLLFQGNIGSNISVK